MPHIHDKIDFCAEVFTVHKNKVLLRKHDKYHIWLSVGGHIELHEDPNEAALREVKEEVGLDIKLYGDITHVESDPHAKELIPPCHLHRHRINENHEHVVFIYFATAQTDKLNIPENEKAECKWLTEKELDDEKFDIKPGIKHYAKEALKLLANN